MARIKYDINTRFNNNTGFNEVRFTNEDALNEFTKMCVEKHIYKPLVKVHYINEWRGITLAEVEVLNTLINSWKYTSKY